MVMTVVSVQAELTAGAATSAGEVAAGGAASGVETEMSATVVETAGWAETAPPCAPPDAPPNVKDWAASPALQGA